MRAPLRLLTVLFFALTALASHRTIAAQATPGANAGLGPNVGDRVRVEDWDRNEIAAVSVTKLADPSSADATEPGLRTVSVDIAVENVGAEAIPLDSYRFSAVDTHGFVYEPRDDYLIFERLDDPHGEPSYTGVRPGEAMGGTVDFRLPADAELAQIVYAPSEQRIPLVDLRPNRPAYDTAVPIVDADGAPLVTIAVSAPTDPYIPPPSDSGFVLTDERYVTFSAIIQNTGRAPFAFSNGDFNVLDTHGFLTNEMPRGEVENDPTGPFLQANDALAPGATASGLIKFLLRDDADPLAVVYIPDDSSAGDRAITVAESGLRPAEPTFPPLFTLQAEVATPDCDGVVAWYNTSFTRQNAATEALRVPASYDELDPNLYRQAAVNLRAAAAAQETSNPPPAASDANAAWVTYLKLAADDAERRAAAIEGGTPAPSDDTLVRFQEGQLEQAFQALAEACPEL